MFTFTTTTIINSDKDYTSKVTLFSGQAADSDKNIPASFDVKRVNKFLVKNIRAVYKREAETVDYAKAEIDLSKCAEVLAAAKAKKGTFRVEMYVHLAQSNNNPLYSNDFVIKGRPFTFEFVVSENDDAQAVVKKVVKMLNKYQIFKMDYTTVKAEADDTKLVLTAVDPYQIFSKVELQYFDVTLGEERACCTPKGEYANVVDYVDDPVTITPGNEGFGTTEWITRNLRLPTIEATRWNAPYADERPIPGALYDQYTLHYCVNRGILGGDAVGDEVHSLTTHVFYVLKAYSSQFEEAMTTAGIDVLDYKTSVDEVSTGNDITSIEATANVAKATAESAKATANEAKTAAATAQAAADANTESIKKYHA